MELSTTRVPEPFQLVASIPCKDPFGLEREIHAHYESVRKYGRKKEFFAISIPEAVHQFHLRSMCAMSRPSKSTTGKKPKKRNSSKCATAKTQQLNEAKDVLLSDPVEKRRQAEKDEQHNEDILLWEKEFAEARRERYARNRKKRAAGSRAHRSIGDYTEGAALVKEMEDFFQSQFLSGGRVMYSEMLKRFTDEWSSSTIGIQSFSNAQQAAASQGLAQRC